MRTVLGAMRKMRGATALLKGRAGSVSIPAAGDQAKFLRADGTWQAISGNSDMLRANNLSDVANISTSRANLDVMSWAQSAGRGAEAIGGLIFNGVINPHEVLVSLTNQNIGTSDFSIWLRFKMPTASASGQPTLYILSDQDSASRPRAFIFFYDAGTHLFAQLYGATSSDFRQLQLTDLRSTRQGQVIDLVLVRNSSGLVPYVNGTQWTATSETTGGTPPAWTDTVTSNYFRVGSQTSTGVPWICYRAAVFNCALTAADIDDLQNIGIALRYKWGNQGEWIASAENRNFDGGTTGNWAGDSGATVSNPDTKLQVTTASSGTSGAYLSRSYIYNIGYRKLFRIKADVWKGTTAATSLTIQLGQVSQSVPLTITQSTVTAELTSPVAGDLHFLIQSSDGGTFYIDNVNVRAIGPILDLDMAIGKGNYIPDRSNNRLWGEKSDSGVTHKVERQNGEFVVVKTLLHWEISATGETTNLFTLPTNCGVVDVEFDRETAFDSGTTLSIGITGNNTKYVNAANVAATGKLLVDSGNKESASATTTVYIKKNQSTTQGQTTIRVRYIIRGI
jgi:hypothetical protein